MPLPAPIQTLLDAALVAKGEADDALLDRGAAAADLVVAQAADNAAAQTLATETAELAAARDSLATALAAYLVPSSPVPPPPPPPPPGRQLLTAGDFALLGHFDVQGNAAPDLPYGSGFTHRYVGGQLRFLTSPFNGGQANVVEFAPAAFGQTVTTLTNTWPEAYPAGWRGGAVWRTLWWDEQSQRLRTSVSLDYPQSGIPIDETRCLGSCVLNPDGTVSGASSLVRLQGVGQRAIVGGTRRVPLWFRTAHGVGEYVSGFGGYTSLMAQGLGPSLGLFLACHPAAETYPDEGLVPDSLLSVLADHRSGATAAQDWYANGSPSTFDRGVRNPDVDNEFDSDTYWKSPAPDGLGRWVWGDSYQSSLCWVDDDAGSRNKHGIITAGTFYSGRAWYETSTLHCERRTAEIHVFDPVHLAEVKAGTRQPWNVKPVSRLDITDILKAGCDALRGRDGAGPEGGIAGATFDPMTNRLWLCSHWTTYSAPYNSRVWCFEVG